MKSQIGVIGLGTMGKALAKNFLSRGYQVSGFNRTFKVTAELKNEAGDSFIATETLEEFVDSLEKPRKIILMLPDGDVTDKQIKAILPLLEKGDILADCGNSYYKNTVRRATEIEKTGIIFFGIGVSGGEKGALLGPSIMVGGNALAYSKISPFLESISAKKEGAPCCAYIGSRGSGHFVKMVHNGIEYADLQLLAETYLMASQMFCMENSAISQMFAEWNKTEAKSYLVEISTAVLDELDPNKNGNLIDNIADRVGAKGTGQWTCQSALELGINVSTIQASVDARNTSQLIIERDFFGKELESQRGFLDLNSSQSDLFGAYMLCKIVAYAQGFSMMKTASDAFGENFNLSEISKIFRAGCIIQAELLDDLVSIFDDGDYDKNFLKHPKMIDILKENLPKLRRIATSAMGAGLPTPCFTSALTYIDQLASPTLGAKLIAAQRDYFGAHKFERIDGEGAVHHDWKNT